MADKKDIVNPWEKLGISPMGIGQVPTVLDIAWAMEKKLTVCLVGETGIGKTPIVHQWCKRKNGFMYPLNFGHMSQEEVSMIMFTEKADSFDFVPPQWLLDLNKQAEEKGCAVLFLDEWNRGDKAMVNALFTLTDERRVHNFRLHQNVLVVSAMNPSDGSYLVNEAEKDHAIRKRLNFIYVTHDLMAFLEYTKADNWHPLVPAFVKAASTHLYDVGARDAGKAFPCPSNWEKVSGILKAAQRARIPFTDNAVARMVEGQIGSITANKFMEFVENQNTMIQPAEILKDYTANSEVRGRVANVLNCRIDKATDKFVEKENKAKSRASVINELNKGLAIELFSAMPEPAVFANNLGRYMGDIPNELLSTFAAQHLFEQAKVKGDAGSRYMTKLSTALAREKPYKEKMHVIAEAIREYKKSANLITDADPML
jgi:hypothetical protein